MSLEAITIHPLCYVLELENGYYYIGSTLDLNKRLAQHFTAKASGWTKIHKPISVVSVFYPTNGIQDENEITKAYIVAHGAEKVRGGSWTRVDVLPPQFSLNDLSGKYVVVSQVIESD
jgi:predicted GIY-YIG superfamily endonuclease